jgi:hypothetical protein
MAQQERPAPVIQMMREHHSVGLPLPEHSIARFAGCGFGASGEPGRS